MRKISNKLLIVLLLFISFICNAKEEVLFSINNNPTTTIDLNQRINYLSLLSNIDINKINKKKYIEDLVSVKLFNEFAEIKNIKTKDKLLNNYYEKIEINNKFFQTSDNRKKITEQKIVQMKEDAIKSIKDASVKIAMESVTKLIKTSINKSKLDTLFEENLNQTKNTLKKTRA